jgi:cyclic beta-1,2-glucan synthetase
MSPSIGELHRDLRARLSLNLSGDGDRLGSPIRGELLGAEHLAERGRILGEVQEWVLPKPSILPREVRLLGRLRETYGILADAQTRIGAAVDRQVDVGPAAAWLLDNLYLLREHIQEAFEGMPPGFYSELPEARNGDLGGYPRVYELCIVLISHTEGRIDRETLELFTAAFQEHAVLRIGELWAVPAMVRFALLENVRRMAQRSVSRLDDVELADAWVDRIEKGAEDPVRKLPAVLGEFMREPPPLTPTFVARLLRQLRVRCGPHPGIHGLEEWVSERGVPAGEAAALAAQEMALTQVIMANSITSLRTVGHLDWKAFVEGQSRLEGELRRDPSGIHSRMTFETRDRYRHVVERIARRTRSPETEVAARAVALARTAAGTASPHPERAPGSEPLPRETHVGYWLLGEGRHTLETAFGYRTGLLERIHRWVLRHPDVVLGGGLAAGTALAVSLVPWLASTGGWEVTIFLLALLPAAHVAVLALSKLVTTFLPPRCVPQLDLRRTGGIPPELSTAVVVPTLFESPAAVEDALEHLEVQFLANREAGLRFGILGDFTDADQAELPGDAAILEAAATGIDRLNHRYGGDGEGPFFLFHRPRLWNPSEGVWMGWERKRGKLVEFNRFLRGEPCGFSSLLGETASLRGVRYVITLDADTVLPPEAALLLVGALAHPLNRAEHDPVTGRVVRGYGVLQPRVGITLPSAHRSRFAVIQSGDPGVDPYGTASSDLYQDLYGEGSFTGKGIYDVDAFRAATEGRFPENTLLSHDLIEGNYARAGLVTEVTVYDDYPGGYLSYTRRKHRWIRGDWQLLPRIGRWVPGPGGLERNPLTRLSRWKIVDNLRRSLLEIALVVFLVVGWTALPGSPLRWTLLGVGALASPWIISLLPALLLPPRRRSLPAYYRALLGDAVSGAQQFALALVFLPHQAWISADAIVRTLWRLAVSRRHLLEWTSSSLAERTSPGDLRSIRAEMVPATLLAVGVLALLLALAAGKGGGEGTVALVVAGPIVLLWIVAPAVAYQTGRRPTTPSRKLPPSGRAQAMRYALLHWAFFERFTGDGTGWLAPDNFQEDPRPVVAMRTSPTNIGLQLLSTMSAWELGILTLPDMVLRLERAFDTLDGLPRYRGHLYNWYDLASLRPLEPLYISTVDSGNLVGHLVALRQGLLALAEGPSRSPLVPESVLAGVDLARATVQEEMERAGRRKGSIGRTLWSQLQEARLALVEVVQEGVGEAAILRIRAPLEEAIRTLEEGGWGAEDGVEEAVERRLRWCLGRLEELATDDAERGELALRLESLASRAEG